MNVYLAVVLFFIATASVMALFSMAAEAGPKIKLLDYVIIHSMGIGCAIASFLLFDHVSDIFLWSETKRWIIYGVAVIIIAATCKTPMWFYRVNLSEYVKRNELDTIKGEDKELS